MSTSHLHLTLRVTAKGGSLALTATALAALLTACAQMPGATPATPATTAATSTPAASAAPAAGAASAAGPVRTAGPGVKPAAGAASAVPAAAPAAPQPGQPPAFANVIKDAKRIDASLPVWQKDEKFWLELSDKDLGVPLFLSPKIAGGIGENGVFGGLMASRWNPYGGPQLVEFRRIHNQIQLIARNTEFAAQPGTPAARAVAAGYSPSLIGSTSVASQPHPERKTFLVEVNGLFAGDLLGLGMQLQRSYRQGYSWDGRNSAITQARGKPDELVLELMQHFATASLAVPQPGAAPGTPAPSTPSYLPDARSLFVRLQLSLTRLPLQPMRPRAADARLGHFVTLTHDFTDDLARTARLRHVNRWRLEKKDPTTALSEPVKPITYWLDRNLPLKYRDVVRDGILEWNRAFEKIGFKDAIVVKQQSDDADFDTLDTSAASVRWMVNGSPSFGAIGPSHVDPRSGEILDADIGLESLSARNLRAARAQVLTASPAVQSADWARLMQAGDLLRELGVAHRHDESCQHADQSAEQLGYALDVLQWRDGLDPAGPEAEAFVRAYLKDVTMHEVGHTLGLRHNFRASRAFSERQTADAAFTATQAFTGSVMEYAPINLGRPGEPRPAPFQTTLGPYDFWAIEYAYRPLAPQQEAAELARIAARSVEPELAYGTDEDNYLGIDPETLQGDLGDDPVAFARNRLEIARDLLARLEQRPLDAQSEYPLLRRIVSYALRDVGRSAGILARQVGGVRTLRDAPGSGRDPLQPLAAERQREALDLLARGVFSAEGLSVSAALQRRLAPDFLERRDALEESGSAVATDYSPANVLAELRRSLLAQLLSDGVAQRLLDSEGKASAPGQTLRLAELHSRLEREIWAELSAPRGDISADRRELQRDHLARLTGQLLRPAAPGRADLRSLQRQQAQALLQKLQAAVKRPGLSTEAQAHLQDGADTLREALAARMLRAG